MLTFVSDHFVMQQDTENGLWRLASAEGAGSSQHTPSQLGLLHSLPPPKQDAIVIDFGTYWVRSGFSSDVEPRLVMRNLVSKRSAQMQFAGSAIPEQDYARSALHRTPFDRDVLLNADVAEQVLDQTFLELGLGLQGPSFQRPASHRVPYPVFMTETLANPNGARRMMNELLFEAYGVPAVGYGVDFLLGANFESSRPLSHPNRRILFDDASSTLEPQHHRGLDPSTSLVISSGHACSYVTCILDGRIDFTGSTRRVPVAGSTISDRLMRALGLRYPSFRNLLTPPVVDAIKSNLCSTATEAGGYWTTCTEWEAHPEDMLKAHRAVVEMWESTASGNNHEGSGNALTEEELLAEAEKEARRQEIRRKNSERLRLMARQKREQKIQEIAEAIARAKDPKSRAQLERALEEKKAVHAQRLAEEEEREQSGEGVPFLSKKEASLRAMTAEERTERISSLLEERGRIIERQRRRIKTRSEWSNRRSEANRRRLRLIVDAAEDDGMGGAGNDDGGMDDNFGANDADWEVYHEINRDMDSDEEAEDTVRLEAIMSELTSLDADLVEKLINSMMDDSVAAASGGDSLMGRKRLRWNGFHYGQSAHAAGLLVGGRGPTNILTLTLERLWAGEMPFYPPMVGVDCAGLSELLAGVCRRFSRPDDQHTLRQLLSNVYVHGGTSQMRGFGQRVYSELRSNAPVDMPVCVWQANADGCDAWRGAAWLVRQSPAAPSSLFMDRKMYEEYGTDYFVDHPFGNVYVPAPPS